MDGSFFRKEVLEAKSSQWYGGMRLKPPRVGWAVAGVAIALIASLVTLLIFGTYLRIERVRGSLVPDTGLTEAVAPATGVITRIFVRQGDHVRKGDLIAEVSAEVSTPLGSAQQAVARQVADSVASLQDDLSTSGDTSRLDTASLKRQIDGNARQRAALATQLAIQRERVASASDLYEKWRTSSVTGVVSKSQLLQQKDVVLQGRSELADLMARQSDLEVQAAHLAGELQSGPLRQQRADNETRRRMVELSSMAVANATMTSAQLRSTSDGIVTAIPGHPGQHVEANQVVATTLPDASRLMAELWVSPGAIGFVEPGTKVRIRYDTYPYQRYGFASGTVLSVSRSALPSTTIQQVTGQTIDGSRYRVDVMLDHEDIHLGAASCPLMPGMTLVADLLLNRQSFLDALLEPLADSQGPTHTANTP